MLESFCNPPVYAYAEECLLVVTRAHSLDIFTGASCLINQDQTLTFSSCLLLSMESAIQRSQLNLFGPNSVLAYRLATVIHPGDSPLGFWPVPRDTWLHIYCNLVHSASVKGSRIPPASLWSKDQFFNFRAAHSKTGCQLPLANLSELKAILKPVGGMVVQ